MADRGRLFYDSDGKLRQVDPTASISGEPAEADLEPVEFEEVLITGHTFIKLSLSSNITGVSGGTYTNPYDTVDEDALNETNASAEFTPTETAYYMIAARARVVPAAAGNLIQINILNVDESSAIELESTESASDSSTTVMGLAALELTAGDTYRIRCRDFEGNYDVLATSTTGAIIYKLPVQPP